MDTREKLMDRARTMFMRYGLKSVTMDDLSRDLGISKKTLYQHVENKKDLIQKVFEFDINREKKLISEILNTAPNAVVEILRIAKYVIGQLRELSPTAIYDMQKYYHDSWKMMEALHQQFTVEVIKSNLNRGIKEGLYRENINVDIIAKLYAGKTSLVVDEDLFPLKDYNKENLFREFITYHIHGIASTEGLKVLNEHYREIED